MMANGGLLKYTNLLYGDLQFYFPMMRTKGKKYPEIHASGKFFILWPPTTKKVRAMRKKSHLWGVLAIIACLLSIDAFSQTVLLPGQPEQDACHALSLCGGKFYTPYSYQGIGLVNDLPTTPCGGGEGNSMWLKIVVATPGWIAFSIIPNDTVDDYDFAVVDITNKSCDNLSQSDVVRCNFNVNFPGSNPEGIVGMDTSSTLTSVQAGFYGDPFVEAINATAGQTFLIMINNYGQDNTNTPSSGFTIDFSASTATFVPPPGPTLKSIAHRCNVSSVTVDLSTQVSCSSIAPDGSDFFITPFVAIDSATGTNCLSANGYTGQVTIWFAGPAPIGNYVLNARVGTDGNTLLDLCGGSLALPASLSFDVPAPVQDNFLLTDTIKCDYSTISVAPDRAFTSYSWSSGQATPSIQVMNPGIYTLTVTDSNACIGVESINVGDSICPQYVYLPNAFTPNGDGRNDVFRPIFAGPTSDFKFAIFDRWGRRVFESANPAAGWDGTTGGKPQPAGMYVWECLYRLYQKPAAIQKGTVMLIR
jgi:gliding motility-associated-like protein